MTDKPNLGPSFRHRKYSFAVSFFLHAGVLAFILLTPALTLAPAPIAISLVERDPAPLAPKNPTSISHPHHVHYEAVPETLGKPAADENPEHSETDLNPTSVHETQSGPQTSASALAVYLGSVVRLIDSNKNYPAVSRAREEEGRVLIQVSLNADGSLIEAKLVQGAIFERLNQSALQSIRQIGHFPPPPEGSKIPFTFTAPLVFKIER